MRVEGTDYTENLTIVTPLEQKPGRNGAQYYFRARILAISDYEMPFWVDQRLMPLAETAEQREKLVNSEHWVVVRKGPLKPPTDTGPYAGMPKDPDLDWNYKYYIQQWDVAAPVGGNTSNGTGGGTGRTGGTNRSIERQVAFKGAIELAVAQLIEIAEVPDLTNAFARAIAGDSEEASDEQETISPAQAERLGITELPDNSEGHMVRDAESLGAVIIEDVPNEEPSPAPCATHGGAIFEYKTSSTGVSKWTHQKDDGGWCIFDGEFPTEAQTAKLPF